MLVRKYSYGWEVAHWAIVLAMALALALTWVSVLQGQNGVPQVLSQDQIENARPMPNVAVVTTSGETLDEYTTTLNLWRAIESFHQGQPKLAAATLSNLELPVYSETWRYLALGAASHMTSDYVEAVQYLEKSLDLDPSNAVAHYLLGKVRLAQAEEALDWYLPPTRTVWVVATLTAPPVDIVPNTRAMYQFAAAQSLRQAVELGTTLDLEQRLLGVDWVSPKGSSGDMPLETPSVRELLASIDAEDFLGKSHLGLAELDLAKGLLRSTSTSLDAASELGMATGDLYQDLGDAFRRDGEPLKARRAYMRSMAHGAGTLVPLQRILSTFGTSLR